MRRRGFLGSVLAATAVPVKAIAVVLPALPVLYGDGRHDDTHALEVALNGGDVLWSDGRPVGDVIDGKKFAISRTIDVACLTRSLTNNWVVPRPR